MRVLILAWIPAPSMRALLPVALVLLLGLLAFLFLVESPQDQKDPSTSESQSSNQPEAASSAGSIPENQGEANQVQRDQSSASGTPWDDHFRWGAPHATEAGDLTLEVVAAGSEEAVPAAVIQLIPERRNVRAGDPDIADENENFSDYWLTEAEAWRTNDAGQIQVPASWRGRTIIARSESAFAVQRLEGDAAITLFTVRIAPSQDTVVRVLDAQDQPVAGVDVGLYREVYQSFHRQLSVVTNADGLAHFHQVQDPGLSRRGMDRWRFAVAPQLGEAGTEAVPRAELPTEVTLRMAVAGNLRIELEEEDGKPALRPLEVIVTTVAQREHHQSVSAWRLGMHGTMTTDGKIDLAGLPAGEELLLLCDFAWQDAGRHRRQEMRVLALEVGESRTVTFRASSDRPTLTFLVLDPLGKPMPETELRTEFRSDLVHTNRIPETPRIITDREGRFRWTLSQGPMATETQELIGRTLRIAYDQAKPRARWQATVDLGRDFESSSTNDMVVQLRDLPLTAGGWVRRPDGKRLASVTVTLAGTPPPEMVDGVRHIKNSRRMSSTSTDEEGRFWLYGENAASHEELELKARGPGGEETVLPVTRGSDQHDLVLDSGGILVGTLRRPRALADLAVTTAFHFPHEDHPDWDYWDMESVDAQGAFRYAGLPDDVEGTLKIALGSGYPGPIVYEVEGVRPWREGMNPDPRLQGIDLDGLVRAFEVVALDSTGEVMPEARFLQITETDGGYSWRTLSSPEGRVSFHGGQDPVEIRIQAKGHYDAVVTLQDGLNEVRMEAAPMAVFHLDRMPDLPPHRSLRLDLEPVDGGGFFQLAESEFGEDGVLETAAPPAGSYEISIDVVTRSEGGWSSTSHDLQLPDGSPYVIVVGRGEGQRFEIIVPEGFYERVIR